MQNVSFNENQCKCELRNRGSIQVIQKNRNCKYYTVSEGKTVKCYLNFQY